MYHLKMLDDYGIWAKKNKLYWVNDNTSLHLIKKGIAIPLEYELREKKVLSSTKYLDLEIQALTMKMKKILEHEKKDKA